MTIAMLCAAAAIWSFWCSLRFLLRAIRCDGKVVGLKECDSDKGGWKVTKAPIFKFKDLNGKTYVVTSSVYAWPARFKKGDPIRVLYLPEDPKSADYPSWFGLWAVTVFFAGSGGICLALAIMGVD